MLSVYKNYPFKIPVRTKIFNLVRIIFLLKGPEQFLLKKLAQQKYWWKKLIPPLYFYPLDSKRQAHRDGVSYVLDVSRMLDHSIYFYDLTDVAWSNLFQILKPDFNIIDAGANIGYLTLQFSKRCPEGTVFSFEPDTENFESLSQNVARNTFANVKTLQIALGEKRSSGALFKVYKNNPGANRILNEAPENAYAQEVVAITSIDELDREDYFKKKIHLIKIDVEGFEWFVLKGAVNLITRNRPILFVELADENLQGQGYSSKELVHYIEQLGYRVVDAKTLRPLVQSQQVQTDIICLPDEKSKSISDNS